MLCIFHVVLQNSMSVRVYLTRSYQIMLELSGEMFNTETAHSKSLLLQKGTTLNNVEKHHIRQYKSDHSEINQFTIIA